MKHIFFILFIFVFFFGKAQKLTRMADSFSGDSTISTGFDTLSLGKSNESHQIPDRVVGVKTVHKKQPQYWLFFYFSTSDITQHPVNISKKNFAYFVKSNNEYLRIPYTGKPTKYSGKDNAGFFLNITAYLDRLQTAKIKFIRFETSDLYHEIILPENKSNTIANIVNMLVE